jgi:hypothetical protein
LSFLAILQYTDGENVVPPEIVTTAVDDDVDGDKNDESEETIEDIDQAFAEYGVDLKSRTLSDRFEMVRTDHVCASMYICLSKSKNV